MRKLSPLGFIVLLSATTGCAASAPAPAKVAEPIAYDAADYNPPSEFNMSFAQGEAKGPAVKRSEPAEISYRARLVSMEKPGEADRRLSASGAPIGLDR